MLLIVNELLRYGRCGGTIPRLPAAGFFLFYLAYVSYEVLATYHIVAPLCIGGTCI